MVQFERLNSGNFTKFNALLQESNEKTKYNLDFYKLYDNKSFIFKYIVRKMVTLIKVDDCFVGYIWIEAPSYKSARLSRIFIKEEYLYRFNESLLSIIKSSSVYFECFEDEYSLKLLRTLKMSRIRLTYLMKLSTDFHNSTLENKDISFKLCSNKDDAKVRCFLQNSIFKEHKRIPLTLDDIKYDEKQSYFIKDLCIFINYKNTPVGYGQVIYSRGIYSIVNLGVLERYRKNGFGFALINELIRRTKLKNINELYIRVEHNNIQAKLLYEKVGFRDVGIFSTWIWNKNLI